MVGLVCKGKSLYGVLTHGIYVRKISEGTIMANLQRAVLVAKADQRKKVLAKVSKLPLTFSVRLELQAFLQEPGRALSL